jgi:hypothetical protein
LFVGVVVEAAREGQIRRDPAQIHPHEQQRPGYAKERRRSQKYRRLYGRLFLNNTPRASRPQCGVVPLPDQGASMIAIECIVLLLYLELNFTRCTVFSENVFCDHSHVYHILSINMRVQ